MFHVQGGEWEVRRNLFGRILQHYLRNGVLFLQSRERANNETTDLSIFAHMTCPDLVSCFIVYVVVVKVFEKDIFFFLLFPHSLMSSLTPAVSSASSVPVPHPPNGAPTTAATTSSSTSKQSRAVTGPTYMENGRKSYVVHGANFEVPSFIDIVKSVGYGAYGLVCAAIDVRTNKKVAVKKNKQVFRDVGDGKRILREVKLLKMFRHENVLSLCTFYVGSGAFDDVYLVTELFDTDLATVIRSKQPVSEDHGKYFIYQVLRGLKYVHSASVVHRDLKPQNILVNLNCDLKLCDFGLARGLSRLDAIEMTDYVVTRWYRPPELIMLNKHYDTSVDVWSTGCIFAELLNRKPLFPGSNYLSQLQHIVGIVGIPDGILSSSSFQNKDAVEFLLNLKLQKKDDNSLQSAIPNSTDPLTADFLGCMLQFDPKKRLSAADLMRHPYLSKLHDPNDEPVSDSQFDWEFDAVETLNRDDLRRLFVAESKEFPEHLAVEL
jgi:mitogen-activated protein kinase 1/3